MTALSAIKEKCLDCSNGSTKEVRLCPNVGCPLYAYRFGKGPSVQISDEERRRRSERAAIARKSL